MITLPETQSVVLRHIMSQDQCEQLIDQLPEFTHSLKAKGPLSPGKWSENFINTQRIRLEEHTEEWIRGLLDIDSDNNNMYACMYRKGDMCKSHVDPVQYTILLSLNNSYTGGELIVDQQQIELDTGDCVVFKGDTKHEVKEITDGVRWSLSIWLF